MDPAQRIRRIRMIEKIEKYPNFSNKIGVKNTSGFVKKQQKKWTAYDRIKPEGERYVIIIIIIIYYLYDWFCWKVFYIWT